MSIITTDHIERFARKIRTTFAKQKLETKAPKLAAILKFLQSHAPSNARGNGPYCLVDFLKNLQKLRLENVDVDQLDEGHQSLLEGKVHSALTKGFQVSWNKSTNACPENTFEKNLVVDLSHKVFFRVMSVSHICAVCGTTCRMSRDILHVARHASKNSQRGSDARDTRHVACDIFLNVDLGSYILPWKILKILQRR